MRIRSMSLIALIALAGLAVAPVAAQDGKPAEKPAAGNASEAPLSGPKVEDNAAPGGGMKMAARAPGEPIDPFERPYPHQVFMEAVNSLAEPGIGASDRLTPEQRKEIRALDAAYQVELRDFRREHREEIMKALRERRERGAGEPEPPRESAPEQPKRPANEKPRPGSRANPIDPEKAEPLKPKGPPSEARQLFQTLREKAPDVAPTHQAIWDVLNDRQRTLVERQLVSWRQARIEERQEKIAADRMKEQERNAVPAPPERTGRLDRFRDLSPEEKRKALERMRKQRETMEREEKRAPEMDDVDVPPPGDD